MVGSVSGIDLEWKKKKKREKGIHVYFFSEKRGKRHFKMNGTEEVQCVL